MNTLLYDISIPAISSLQSQLNEQANFMQLMSVVFDPKYAFLIYSPLAYLLDQKMGKKLMLTTVLTEWLNMILKWFLQGERPYWYVHSSGHFDAQQVPIKQFPITCELGPGHPSGHAMVTAAVWYIILNSILQKYETNLATNTPMSDKRFSSKQLRTSIWTIYALLLITVSISRVFLGCHFPHQCVVGAMLGFLVAKWVSSLDTSASHFIKASVFMLVSAFGTYVFLQSVGFDPSWTIKLATKHCAKREYIHPDTAPFFSIMRYCGFALGCGLGLLVPLNNYTKQLIPTEGQVLVAGDKESSHVVSSKNIPWFSIKLVMALLMARLVDNLGLFVSQASPPLFYSGAFFAYTLFSLAFINL